MFRRKNTRGLAAAVLFALTLLSPLPAGAQGKGAPSGYVPSRNGRQLVNVLREDPDLGQHLGSAQAEAATGCAVARVVCLPKAPFLPHEKLPREHGLFGLLVLDGLLLRSITVADRPSLEVLGPGDVVRPSYPEADPHGVVLVWVGWWALSPARLAVLDAGFIRRMSGYPEVIAELAGRLSRVSAGGSLRLSIVQQPRAPVR